MRKCGAFWFSFLTFNVKKNSRVGFRGNPQSRTFVCKDLDSSVYFEYFYITCRLKKNMNLLIITEKSAKFKEQMGVWKETFKRINCWLKPSYLKNSNNIISSSVVFILLMKVWEYRKDWWPFTNGWFSLQRNHRRLLCNNTRYKTQ